MKALSLVFRQLRNSQCHREEYFNSFWGAFIFCVKEIGNIAYDYNDQMIVPISLEKKKRTPMAIVNVLVMVQEVEEHIDIEIVDDIGANSVAPLNIKQKVNLLCILTLTTLI